MPMTDEEVFGVQPMSDAQVFGDRRKQPRIASTFSEAVDAGYQGSTRGLIARGRMPDIVLDPQHAKWWQSLASSAAQMVSELPEMIGGAAAGAPAGAAIGAAVTGPAAPAGAVVGGIIGGGAGAFAVPTAIRQSLIQAYSKGEVTGVADFLSRTAIVAKETAKDALVGGLTAGAGGLAARTVGKVVAPMIGETLSVGGANAAINTAGAVTEGTTMVTANAALSGHLPEKEDFLNAAIMIGGLHAATHVAGKVANIYARTGVEPAQVVADAKADPQIAAELKSSQAANIEGSSTKVVTADELPVAYRPLAAETAARDAFPGDKAQAVLDHPFADIPDAQVPYQLNLKSIDGPDALRATVARMNEVYLADGKPQSHAETEAKAEAVLNDLMGPDAQKILAGRERGTAASAVDMKVRGDLLMQAANDAAAAIKTHNDAKAAGTATDQMKLDALDAINKLAMIQSDFAGGLTEAARAVEYAKRFKELRQDTARMKELVDMYGGDPDTLLKVAGEISTPEGMAKFSRDAAKATTMEMVNEAVKMGMISGPFTQMANLMGNTTFAALRPVVETVAAGIGMFRSGPDRVTAMEPVARLVGNLHGTIDALTYVGKMLRVEGVKATWENWKDATDRGSGKTDTKRGAIPGETGRVLRTLTFGQLSAVDALFRTMNERGEAYSLATRQATSEGLNPLTREFRKRVVEISQNPDAKMAEAIKAAGDRLTFNTKGGPIAQAVQDLLGAAPVLRLVVPFVQTPGNIAKELLRMTPAAFAIKEWRQALSEGGAARDKAVAEVLVGAAIGGVAVSFAMAGNISGAGDPDPNKKRTMMAAGWQPYSIKIGDKWYSYQRLQPVGTLLGMYADMHEVSEHMTPEERDKTPKMLAVAMGNAITSQTFLQGFANIIHAITEPDRYGAKFAQGIAGLVIPGVIAQNAQLNDPYIREINSAIDAVKNRIPFARETLVAQRDTFGEKIANRERLGVVSPIQTNTVTDDPVRAEAARLKVGVAKAPESIELPAGHDHKLGEVALTPDQQDKFGDVAGHLAHEIMAPMVNSPMWAHAPDMIKKRAFDIVFEKARGVARATVLTPEQRQAEIVRITGELAKRLSQPIEKNTTE